MAKKFNVSEETIRRDLKKLEDKKIAERTYGGAFLNRDFESSKHSVPVLEKRLQKNRLEKIGIAKKAVDLILNNRFILLDAGSTTGYIAKRLIKTDFEKTISIITNGLNVAEHCSKNNNINVYLLGGALRSNTLSLVGPQAIEEIKKYNIDIAFLGTTGISLQRGFSSSNINEIEVKKTMVAESKKVIVVSDHSKFAKEGLKAYCNFEDVDALITSELVNKKTISKIEDMGVKVYSTKI